MPANKKMIAMAVAMGLGCSTPALATNGMNLEGIGPVSWGMGGTGLAFEHGSAAMMLNPATLAMMPDNTDRVDVAVSELRPDVKATVITPMGEYSAKSQSDAFDMPALGWVKKTGKLAIGFGGVGMFPQGGMGTQYKPESVLGEPCMSKNEMPGSCNLDRLQNRSEVGVARFILPLALEVNDKLNIGGSLDAVFVSMDLRMSMSEAQFQNLLTTKTMGSASGSMVQALGMMYEPFGGHGVSNIHNAYFDFSNSDPMFGKAQAWGVAGKLGFTYKVDPKFTIGGVYHTETALQDLSTSGATMSMGVRMDTGLIQTGTPNGQYADMTIPVKGTIKVKDFQWPAMVGLGGAYQATDKLLLALDVKRIFWADVMRQMKMSFSAENSPANGPFAGLNLDATLKQEWSDQTVVAIGGAYKVTPELTLRAGYNYGDNPVPSKYMNPLFPAIVESAVTAGVGYQWSPSSSIDFAVASTANKSVTNPGNAGEGIPAVKVDHSQLSWSLMYSYRF